LRYFILRLIAKYQRQEGIDGTNDERYAPSDKIVHFQVRLIVENVSKQLEQIKALVEHPKVVGTARVVQKNV
jgi:hypothetical protein